MRIYTDLVPWYRLLDPPEDHRDEAASYQAALERGADRPPETLLELGAGAGHNAFHLKRRFRCTLTDVSEAMLALSRALNPGCEHLPGDMRHLRLGRSFDAVLVHDAVMYMTSEQDLRAAIDTAYAHTRPGGAALFAPDHLADGFQERTTLLEGQEGDGGGDGARALRGVEWAWDPDPGDTTCQVDYALLLRDGPTVTAAHDRHIEGLFPRATWIGLLQAAGFQVESTPRPLDDDGGFDDVFLCRRRAGQ